jgi:hypothetical protein
VAKGDVNKGRETYLAKLPGKMAYPAPKEKEQDEEYD